MKHPTQNALVSNPQSFVFFIDGMNILILVLRFYFQEPDACHLPGPRFSVIVIGILKLNLGMQEDGGR